MYGLIGLMGEKFGAPYNTFPFSCMEFGKSATGNSGGTCGCLMGGAQALSLFFPRKVAVPMQKKLFRWYEVTSLPVFQPSPGTAKIDKELLTSVSDSILCHISVARWCSKTGIASGAKERSERCARITADTAYQVAMIINQQIDGTFDKTVVRSEVFETCTAEGCHGSNPENYASTSFKGDMDCTPCHTGTEFVQNKMVDHP